MSLARFHNWLRDRLGFRSYVYDALTWTMSAIERIERKIDMSSADLMNDLAQIKQLFAGKASDLQAKLDAAKAAWQADDEAKWNEAHTAAQSIIADMQGTAQQPAPASAAPAGGVSDPSATQGGADAGGAAQG